MQKINFKKLLIIALWIYHSDFQHSDEHIRQLMSRVLFENSSDCNFYLGSLNSRARIDFLCIDRLKLEIFLPQIFAHIRWGLSWKKEVTLGINSWMRVRQLLRRVHKCGKIHFIWSNYLQCLGEFMVVELIN